MALPAPPFRKGLPFLLATNILFAKQVQQGQLDNLENAFFVIKGVVHAVPMLPKALLSTTNARCSMAHIYCEQQQLSSQRCKLQRSPTEDTRGALSTFILVPILDHSHYVHYNGHHNLTSSHAQAKILKFVHL